MPKGDKAARRGVLTRQRIVRAICAYRNENGFPPSYRDIAAIAGLSGINIVERHLRILEAEGVVRPRPPGSKRTVVLNHKALPEGAEVRPVVACDRNDNDSVC